MLLFWPLVIPFATAVACILAWRRVRLQRAVSLAGAAALLATATHILARVLRDGPFAAQAGGWPAPFGISMVADRLSATLLVLTGIVAVASIAFATADATPDEEANGHHALTHALLAGISGAFLTGDIFNLYVWFEVMLIASFGLLVIGGTPAALDGATKYVGLNLIATVAFISGVGLLYGATGALNMADLHGRLAGRMGETPVLAAAAFLLFAFASKAALFPLFFWLPASYHTPSFATSALFAAILTKVGVYAVLRVFTLVFDIDGTPIQPLLLAASLGGILAGTLGALAMGGMRRVLGFTIVSSIGGMLLGFAVATPLALAGSVLYLVQDVVVKANLFLAAGAASRLSGARGLWRDRPWTSLLFLVPALSLAGMPPLSGFWPKLMLVRATLDDGRPGLALAILALGFLTLLAMARLWSDVFWTDRPTAPVSAPVSGPDAPARLPAAMAAPLIALTALVVAMGLGAAPLVALAAAIAADLADPSAYVAAVLGAQP